MCHLSLKRSRQQGLLLFYLMDETTLCLIHKMSSRSDSSLFSSLFSWTSESSSNRVLTPDDQQAQTTAAECIQDCHPEALFAESKFLMEDSLMELAKVSCDCSSVVYMSVL